MNNVLKSILKTAEAVAVASVPGAAMVDGAVRGIVKHDGHTDDHVLDAAEGAIQAIENIKGTEIADEVKFRAGVATIEAGFKLVRESLHVEHPAAPAA